MRIGHTNSDYSGSRLAGEEIEKESVCIILVTSIQLSMYFPLQYQAQSRTACPGHVKFVLDTRGPLSLLKSRGRSIRKPIGAI